MKRIAAFLTALILVASMMVVPTFAADAPTVYATKVSGNPGDTVVVGVGVKNNPGMVTMSFTVSFDTSVLQLTKTASTGLLNGAVLNKKYNSPYKVTFVDYDLEEDMEEDGILAKFTFKILDTAAAGKTTITVQYNDSYKTDMATKNTFTTENGEVEVLGASDPVASVMKNGAEVEQYTTVKAAADACTAGSYVQLIDDTEETFTCTKDLYLDLAGHTLSGSVNMGSCTLYGMDSTTDTYGDAAGKLTASVTGNVAATVKVADPYLASGLVRRYVAVKASDNSYTFNRFYIGVSAIALHSVSGEVGYTMAVAGNSAVKNALDGSNAYGIRVWAGEGVTAAQAKSNGTLKEFTKDSSEFKTGSAGNKADITIENQLATIAEDPTAYESVPVHAEVFIHFAGVDEVSSATYTYSIQNMFKLMDTAFSSWSETEKSNVKALYEKYTYMANWGLTNIAAY